MAGEFFVDAMTTSLKTGELLVEVRVPQVPLRTGWSFQEVSRRHGDFALMGVAGLLPSAVTEPSSEPGWFFAVRHRIAHRRSNSSSWDSGLNLLCFATQPIERRQIWNPIPIFTPAPNTERKSPRCWRGESWNKRPRGLRLQHR